MLRVALSLVVAVAVAAPMAVGAQSASDFVAWASLIRSPHGAFAPDRPGAQTDGGSKSSIRARYGSWSFGPGDDETTNLGLGVDFQVGRRTLRIDALQSSVKNCSTCQSMGVSAGMVFPLMSAKDAAAPGLEISLIPGVGYASANDGDVSLLTGSVEVPLAVRVNVGSLRLRPFFTPGYGYGRASNDTDSESGTLPSYGYGIALGGSRWDASVGVRQVMLEDAPDVMGFNLAWRW